MKNKIIILLVVLIAFSCSVKETDDYKLVSFIKLNNHVVEDYDHILRISETGCVGCNKSFARLVKEYVQSDNNLFIISAKGATVDISPYLDTKNSKNIIFDYENKFGPLKIVENSGIIFLKDNKIDTIINIEAKGIEETLRFIDSKLK